MPNTASGTRAICPFFDSADRVTVCCREAGAVRLLMRFGSRAEREAHQRAYCDGWKYGACVLAEVLLRRSEKGLE